MMWTIQRKANELIQKLVDTQAQSLQGCIAGQCHKEFLCVWILQNCWWCHVGSMRIITILMQQRMISATTTATGCVVIIHEDIETNVIATFFKMTLPHFGHL